MNDSLHFVDRTYVLWRGHKLSFFAGCDYFRLSSHPAVLKSLHAAIIKLGLSVSASRLTTGNHPVFENLESDLCDFFGAESALLVSSGYLSSTVACQALAELVTHAFIDQRCHSALKDACRFLNCPVTPFEHRNATDLKKKLKRAKPGATIVLLTDGLFAHDGSAAPLADYRRSLPPNAWLVVDDAHGAAVLGRTGQGTPEYEHVARTHLIQTITLSKALGSYGGAVLAPRSIRERMFHCPGFVGSTPIPLPLAESARTALKLLKAGRFLDKLNANSARLKAAAVESGLPVATTPGPIISLPPLDKRAAAEAQAILLRHRIFPSIIRNYTPGTPDHLRFVISSEHTAAQVQSLSKALRSLGALFKI